MSLGLHDSICFRMFLIICVTLCRLNDILQVFILYISCVFVGKGCGVLELYDIQYFKLFFIFWLFL